MYKDPVPLPGIGGSDHLCVLYEPNMHIHQRIPKQKVFIRKFPKSAIIEFGAWITSFKWTRLLEITDVNQKSLTFPILCGL